MRNSPQSYGKIDVGKMSEKRVVDMLKGDPLSDHFDLPRIRNEKEALTLLLAEQGRYNYGNALDVLSYTILKRNFKLLLKEYTPEELARGIVYAARVARNPSTTKHVKECTEWIRRQRLSTST